MHVLGLLCKNVAETAYCVCQMFCSTGIYEIFGEYQEIKQTGELSLIMEASKHDDRLMSFLRVGRFETTSVLTADHSCTAAGW